MVYLSVLCLMEVCESEIQIELNSSLLEAFGSNSQKSWTASGQTTLSKLWLKFWPKVKVSKALGKWRPGLSNTDVVALYPVNNSDLDAFQGFIEAITQGEVL